MQDRNLVMHGAALHTQRAGAVPRSVHLLKSGSAVMLLKVLSQTHVRGVLQASSNSASGLPAAGFWSYSHLPPAETLITAACLQLEAAPFWPRHMVSASCKAKPNGQTRQGCAEFPQRQQRPPHLAVRGSDIRMDSILPPVRNPNVVPRS